MINAAMRIYDFYTLGERDAYGQQIISSSPAGQIKMAISLTSHTNQDNILYKDAQYIGLTHAPVDDSYVIQYGEDRLKVLFVTPGGRYNQVFMTNL